MEGHDVRIILTVIFALWISEVNAGPYVILGSGNTTCGAWIRAGTAPLTGNTQLDATNANTYLTSYGWIVGYLAFFNVMASSNNLVTGVHDGKPHTDVTENYAIPDVMDFTMAWCRAHPLEKLITAADATITELLSKIKK
jgi:hypothetical protein